MMVSNAYLKKCSDQSKKSIEELTKRVAELEKQMEYILSPPWET